MRASENPVASRWRIVDADLWDRDYWDLCGPATLVVQASGHGGIAFGAMQASLDIDYGPDEIGFTWAGFHGPLRLRPSSALALREEADSANDPDRLAAIGLRRAEASAERGTIAPPRS